MKQNKKFYEPPHMEVVELKSRQTLLTGSQSQLENYQNGGKLWDDEEES